MTDRTIYDHRMAVEATRPLTPEQIADVISRLEFIAPRSGNVHGIAWHDDALFVKFHDGKVYRYTANYLDLNGHYTNMLHSDSPGGYFAANIRNNKAISCQFIGTHAEAVLGERHENGDGV